MSGRRKRGKKADLTQKNCELQNNLHVASANDVIEMESGVDDMLQGEDDEGAFSYLAARDDEDVLDRSHSTIDDVLPERNDEGVLPDMEDWDNEDVSEEYDSSVDDMLPERNDGEGFSDIGGWNNEDASEEYDSSVDGMLSEENAQEVFSNLDSYAKEDKTNGMVAHNKEDRRKLVLKTYGAFRASRQKFKVAKKSQEKSADVKDTSLIHMEQLFKNSVVIHKFLWGHDCYFNGYHYEVLTEEAFCALCKNCIDKDVQGKITRMHNYTDLYKFVTLHDPNETIAETKENYFVSFTNGVLDVHSLEFYFRHDPQFEVAFTVNAEYHPTDSKHMAYRCFYETVTYDFLNQMCDGDKDSLQLILQMIGFFVLHVTPKRAFFWMGPAPASGKGVLLDLICRLLGSA